jgi:chemotaxis family two-component system response regulator PixG
MSATTHATGISRLRSQLALYSKQKFTGRLDLEGAAGQRWSLYISLGFLVWATGGRHPKRRWRRQLVRCGHKAYASPITLRETDEYECWDYHALTTLAERQAIAPQQITSVIRGIITEVLFDIMQGVATQTHPDCFQLRPKIGVRPSSTSTGILRRKWTLEIEPTFQEVELEWQTWLKAGLAYYSPDSAPYVQDAQQLRLATSALLYQKLSGLVTGRSPIRDLAAIANKEVTFLGRSLSWYFLHHLIGLRAVADLSTHYINKRAAHPHQQALRRVGDRRYGLIACIDDCARTCELLETLVHPTGYQLISLQDSVQALPILLEQQPDLIFINLSMPIVSGYELCTQIRRVSHCQEIPIIILADHKSFIDRMRANLVGATDFLAKPLQPEAAISIVQQYLGESPTWSQEIADRSF